MNPMDAGMGPGPGRSSSDYSGATEVRHCGGCGVEMGSYTPAKWARIIEHATCGGDPHEGEDTDETDAESHQDGTCLCAETTCTDGCGPGSDRHCHCGDPSRARRA